MKNNERNMSLDLLRIISMLMVVCLHFYGHGGLTEAALIPGTFNWFAGNTMTALCLVAVNCFVLLSGYFLCGVDFKLKRIVGVWTQTLFYSVLLSIVAMLLKDAFSVKELIKSFLPVTMQRYWFVTAYLLLCAVVPFLNEAIRHMGKRMHFLCCCVLLLLFSILHNVIYISDFGYINGGYSFLWFCVLYTVAAYIRQYVPVERKHKKRLFIVYGIGAFMITADRFLAYAVTPFIFGRVVLSSLFYPYNSILMVIASISLFLAMRAVEIKGKHAIKTIGFFAPISFGVYLIHDHHILRGLLWKWLEPSVYAESPWMIPYAFLCIIGIFLICALLEWCRKKLFLFTKIDKTVNAVSEFAEEKVQKKLDSLFGEKH